MGKLSFKRFLVAMILSIHVLFLIFLVCAPPLKPQREQRMRVQLQKLKLPSSKAQTLPNTTLTSHLTSERSGSKVQVNRQSTKPTTPRVQEGKHKKNEPAKISKPIAKKSEVQSKNVPSPIKKPVISEDLMKELEQSIAKIEKKLDAPSSKSTLFANAEDPVPLIALSSFTPISSVDPLSHEEIKELLVQELRSVLHLPEHGEVKMLLTFKADGSIAELKVLKTASGKNEDYLKKELPNHRFPFLLEFGLKEKSLSFVITFCNDR